MQMRGPKRIMDEVAMGGEPKPSTAIYVRGAQRLNFLVRTGGLTNYRTQLARDGEDFYFPSQEILNTHNGTYPEWRPFYIEFVGACMWDWLRIVFFGPLDQDTHVASDWADGVPIDLGEAYFNNGEGFNTATTATTELTLVAGVDFTVSADGKTATPLVAGQLTDFATDGAITFPTYTIREDEEETTADAFVYYDADPSAQGLIEPSSLSPAEGGSDSHGVYLKGPNA